MSADDLKAEIRAAFASVEYPGDDRLRGNDQGDEPFDVERDFRGRTSWQELDPAFIDQSPGGLGSALSFLSDAAFHFYIAAYMVADIDGRLEHSDPLFHLTSNLGGSALSVRFRPTDELTMHEAACVKFSVFTPAQCRAVDAYLCFRRDQEPEFESQVAKINEALYSYWIDGGAEPS